MQSRLARLAARGLACRRGDRVLFRGLDLDLAAGAALHVTAPNGIGKSSLLRLLGGLLRPFAGTVERSGQAGLLDERPALEPHWPLGRALGFWRSLDGGAVAASAVPMALEPLLDVPVRYLSTGQRKRAAMARLIGEGADIWLLDEPFNGLDAQGRAMIELACAGFLDAGGICVIASHQPFDLPGLARLVLDKYAAAA